MDEAARREIEFNPTAAPYARLLPPERFTHERCSAEQRNSVLPDSGAATIRENSSVIAGHQTSTCAGWRVRPTPKEFYDAIRAEQPSKRERVILRQWTQEAQPQEVLLAFAEDAYTMRELVTALHRAGLNTCRLARVINGFAH